MHRALPVLVFVAGLLPSTFVPLLGAEWSPQRAAQDPRRSSESVVCLEAGRITRRSVRLLSHRHDVSTRAADSAARVG